MKSKIKLAITKVLTELESIYSASRNREFDRELKSIVREVFPRLEATGFETIGLEQLISKQQVRRENLQNTPRLKTIKFPWRRPVY
jgi:hypothetical protein